MKTLSTSTRDARVKRLLIAEKPNMAREIAAQMGSPVVRKDGYLEVGNDLVSWCVGHLLQQVGPDGYDPKYEKWPGEFADLPIVPTQWKLEVSSGKSGQVSIIRKLLKQCDEVINAGDPGREGQLIIDELLEFCGNKKPVKRIILNSLDVPTIKRELKNLHDNTLPQFRGQYEAGLGRQRADWLVGMNMSRAYTILARRSNYNGVLSVGRVQSPTLAIVVRRDREIEHFVPRDYWAIKALIQIAGGEFWARWKKPDPAPSWLDEDGRIVDAQQAARIVQSTQGQKGTITRFEQKPGQEEAPLPFSLATLQMHASSKWGYTAQAVLDACQLLYEKKFASYPRSESTHLPLAQLPEVPGVLASMGVNFPAFQSLLAKANPALQGKAWDDSKVQEHHAIIPTAVTGDMNGLSAIERNLFEAINKRYLAQFFPACLVDKAVVEASIAQEVFVANGRIVTSPGWREVYAGEPDEVEEDANGKSNEEDKEAEQSFPPMKAGDVAGARQTVSEQKKTKPPARYNDATILRAMTNIHQLVKDPALKQRLMAAKGIGTAATRAAILENLVKKGLLQREKKTLISSAAARALVDALPPGLVDPALSAMWETALDAILQGKTTLNAFMQKQEAWLRQLVTAAQSVVIQNLPPSAAPSYSNGGGGSGGNGARSGTASRAPAKPAPAGAPTCPKCKKGKMVQRVAKGGPNAGKPFLGCTNYPACKHAEPVK